MQHDNQDSVPTITTVSESFAQWRASGNKRRYTPDQLQQQTVSLLQQHSKSLLCKSLNVSYSALNQWILRWPVGNTTSATPPASGFVPLPAETPAPLATHALSDDQNRTTELRITLPNGTSLNTTAPMSVLVTQIHQLSTPVVLDVEKSA
jgi:transposase-like protein